MDEYKNEYCVRCKKLHKNIHGWIYKKWETDIGYVKGWGCAEPSQIKSHEFVPQRIKNEREKYLKSQIQSHRQGELSSEFVEHYPQKTKEMVSAGVISKEEVKKAKPVWKGLPNYNNLKKTQ